ncbi:MAG: hypothetical protein ACI4RV_06985 [Eubacteriales bacterium]
MANKVRQKTVTRALSERANDFFKAQYPNDVTRKAFCANYKRFIRFCRERYRCKSEDECQTHIADYAKHLSSETAFTPSTIHAYLAPVCIYYGINLKELSKPLRRTSAYTRGRSGNGRTERNDNDISNPKYRHLADFQLRVGLRRAELQRLTGADLVMDESGKMCVKVKKGKGGKNQLQKILPVDREFVASYFKDKQPDERIFTAEEMRNKLNLHRLRALCAQNACRYYSERLETEGEAYRQQLIREIAARWNTYNLNPITGKPKPLNKRLLRGKYFLRGENKKFAEQHGLPVAYDRLALTAVSIFHLSHWRNDVSAESYLLAI